ncbi:hypothetical protein [Canibacter zhoujuaniae]|uniref:hypothetical protein n=1 Tax=Canibacter zhoujuaniae TaxID=2708343 RepID=UPI001424A1B8|nr:hypothetical protein [Canibacter zhoujuaniae]
MSLDTTAVMQIVFGATVLLVCAAIVTLIICQQRRCKFCRDYGVPKNVSWQLIWLFPLGREYIAQLRAAHVTNIADISETVGEMPKDAWAEIKLPETAVAQLRGLSSSDRSEQTTSYSSGKSLPQQRKLKVCYTDEDLTAKYETIFETARDTVRAHYN